MEVLTHIREGCGNDVAAPWSHQARLDEIKRQIAAGTYLTAARLDGAIDALHRDLSNAPALCPASV